jgi:hypothetical protein
VEVVVLVAVGQWAFLRLPLLQQALEMCLYAIHPKETMGVPPTVAPLLLQQLVVVAVVVAHLKTVQTTVAQPLTTKVVTV